MQSGGAYYRSDSCLWRLQRSFGPTTCRRCHRTCTSNKTDGKWKPMTLRTNLFVYIMHILHRQYDTTATRAEASAPGPLSRVPMALVSNSEFTEPPPHPPKHAHTYTHLLPTGQTLAAATTQLPLSVRSLLQQGDHCMQWHHVGNGFASIRGMHGRRVLAQAAHVS